MAGRLGSDRACSGSVRNSRLRRRQVGKRQQRGLREGRAAVEADGNGGAPGRRPNAKFGE